MEDSYNIFADLLDTYQSLPDWLKLVWALLSFIFMFSIVALFLFYRFKCKQLKQPKYDVPDHLSYSIHHINDSQTMAYRYDEDGNRQRFLNQDDDALQLGNSGDHRLEKDLL